jgi:hypothetical protein
MAGNTVPAAIYGAGDVDGNVYDDTTTVGSSLALASGTWIGKTTTAHEGTVNISSITNKVGVRGANAFYGFAVFKFDALPADYELACKWMARHWYLQHAARAAGTVATIKSTLWPGWAGRT